jgi:hypothetical protein
MLKTETLTFLETTKRLQEIDDKGDRSEARLKESGSRAVGVAVRAEWCEMAGEETLARALELGADYAVGGSGPAGDSFSLVAQVQFEPGSPENGER